MGDLSKIYNFINESENISIQLFEGTSLINTQLKRVDPPLQSFYKNSLLSILPLIQFLKPQEHLGIYIDGDNPFLRLKVEMNFTGKFRTLLLPKGFESFSNKISGQCRITKFLPSSNKPYTSIIHLESLNESEIINKILKDSWQFDSKVFPISSNNFHQSVLINLLPNKNKTITLNECWLKNSNIFNHFNNSQIQEEEIIKFYKQNNFNYLGSKEIHFNCPCSQEGMLKNLSTLSIGELQEIYDEGKSINIECDYCNTNYEIKPAEINQIIKEK